MSTLTLNQLQRTYGAALYELKSEAQRQTEAANPAAAASNSQEIIPDENNPLFMSVEQRAEAFARQQRIAQNEPEPSAPNTDPNYWGTPAAAKFIDAMKIKYTSVKDAAPVEASFAPFMLSEALSMEEGEARNTLIAKSTFSEEDNRKRMGNPFVIKTGEFFVRIIDQQSSIKNNQQSIDQHLQNVQDQPDASQTYWIDKAQANINETRSSMKTLLTSLKNFTKQYGTESEASAFFTDYTAFVTGKSQSLEALYRDLGVA